MIANFELALRKDAAPESLQTIQGVLTWHARCAPGPFADLIVLIGVLVALGKQGVYQGREIIGLTYDRIPLYAAGPRHAICTLAQNRIGLIRVKTLRHSW